MGVGGGGRMISLMYLCFFPFFCTDVLRGRWGTPARHMCHPLLVMCVQLARVLVCRRHGTLTVSLALGLTTSDRSPNQRRGDQEGGAKEGGMQPCRIARQADSQFFVWLGCLSPLLACNCNSRQTFQSSC